MPSGGANKKPTALKIANGNPGQGKLNLSEPKPTERLSLIPPAELPLEARRVWLELAPRLVKLGIATALDANAFKRYCVQCSLWKDCFDHIIEHGTDEICRSEPDAEGKTTITGIFAYPQTKRMREIEVLLMRYEASFGLNPVARSNIVANVSGDDELDQLLQTSTATPTTIPLN